MSSLIFLTEEKQAFIATDTLAVNPDGSPHHFTSKAFYVPHLGLIVAGTGSGEMIGEWFAELNRFLVRGIDHLNSCAPRAIARIWARLKEKYPYPDDFMTTVYHFGFSEVTGLVHSYAYRSTAGFESELLNYGTGLKPAGDIPDYLQLPNHLRQIMESQRAQQAEKPANERVYIGGSIIAHHLHEAGCSVFFVDRFDDYEADERAMYGSFLREQCAKGLSLRRPGEV